jgi:hypothetical protein
VLEFLVCEACYCRNTTKYLPLTRTIYDNEEEITKRIKTQIFRKLIAMIMKMQMEKFIINRDNSPKQLSKSPVETSKPTKKEDTTFSKTE